MFLSYEEGKKRSIETTQQKFDEHKFEKYEFVARGDVITMYDPSNLDKKGICQDMTHFIRDEKGQLVEISTEEANKRAKPGKPQKLESKYYGGGFMAFADAQGQVASLDLSQKRQGKIEILSYEEGKKRSVEATQQKFNEQKFEKYEFVARGDVIMMYDSSNLDKKGVCRDMTHFIKDEKGQLVEISTEEANKRAKPGKPQKLESKYYGDGFMAFTDTQGQVVSLDLSQRDKDKSHTKNNGNNLVAMVAREAGR